MEDTTASEFAANDSDEDIDFTARKKHGKQALRIEETDSEDEVDTPPVADSVNANELGNNSDQESNESKESSDDEDDDGNASIVSRKKKRRKKKSDEREIVDNEVYVYFVIVIQCVRYVVQC